MDERTLSRRLKFIDSYKTASNAASGSEVDSNANVAVKNIATMAAEIYKKDSIELNRKITSDYITKLFGEELGSQYLDDLAKHIIYRHDETSLFPYCCSISLYPFLLDGLKKLGGTSEAPKHCESYIGGLLNLVFLVAAQFAGAVAIPEFLTYFDHFLRVDYGEDYINHLDEPVELIGSRQLTLKNKIENWFQEFVYCINQPAAARGYQSPFTNIAYFDKYYFESIFADFIFPDGDEPKWETTKELQKMFMKWFNKERLKTIITFPVESANILVENGKYKDEEMADFFAGMWAEGHSFFMYQSDSVDSLSSCCRLRNGITDNIFTTSMGAGGIETGSKCVITLNLNRIVQDWYNEEYNKLYKRNKKSLNEYISIITDRVHKYLSGWNEKLWDDYTAGLLSVYNAGFIQLDRQYLTVGVNGFVEAAEFLQSCGQYVPDEFKGISVDPDNSGYKALAAAILNTIKESNHAAKDEHHMYNTEFVPGENCSAKLYNWDKKDGYLVPAGRNLYNSYFYIVEDQTVDPVKKFYYQGRGFADQCDGGVALHCGLDSHLSKTQYRKLMDVAVDAGCNYFTFNIPNTVCKECSHISKNYLDHCECCGSTKLDYATRVIGYLRLISNFSESRQIEAAKRYYAHLGEEEC